MEGAEKAVECCQNCERPKVRTNVAGQEEYLGWAACANPECPSYGESTAAAVYRRPSQLAAAERE